MASQQTQQPVRSYTQVRLKHHKSGDRRFEIHGVEGLAIDGIRYKIEITERYADFIPTVRPLERRKDGDIKPIPGYCVAFPEPSGGPGRRFTMSRVPGFVENGEYPLYRHDDHRLLLIWCKLEARNGQNSR